MRRIHISDSNRTSIYSDMDIGQNSNLNTDAREFIPSNSNNKFIDHQYMQTKINNCNLMAFNEGIDAVNFSPQVPYEDNVVL